LLTTREEVKKMDPQICEAMASALASPGSAATTVLVVILVVIVRRERRIEITL
jgi:hypothetical protein